MSLSLAACGGAHHDDIAVVHEGERVCPAARTTLGVDVSSYQQVIDWGSVEGSGVAFAIARVSDGLGHPDARFESNWRAMKAAGLVRGAYQYFEPGEDAGLQADRVVDAIGELEPGDLPATIDVEATGGKTPSQIAGAVETWIARVLSGTKKAPLVYTARYVWDGEVTGAVASPSPALWVANYGAPCPDLPEAWHDWTLWQFDDAHRISGIGVDVDADWFNGDLDALRAFSGLLPEDAGSRAGDRLLDAQVPTDAARDAGGVIDPPRVPVEERQDDAGRRSRATDAYDATAPSSDPRAAGEATGSNIAGAAGISASPDPSRVARRQAGCSLATCSAGVTEPWPVVVFFALIGRRRRLPLRI